MENLSSESTDPLVRLAVLAGAGVVVAFMLCEYFSERRRKHEFRQAWNAEPANPHFQSVEEVTAGTANSFRNFVKRHGSRYCLVVFFVTLAGIVRWLLNPALGDRLPYTFFLAAVVLTARTAGIWKTMLALVLGYLAGTWFIAEPNSLLITESFDFWAAGLYFFIGLGLVWFLKSDRATWLRTLRNDIVISKQMLVVRQKQAANTVDASELMANIVASAQDAIFSVTPQGRIMTWNAAAERLFQIPIFEALGRPLASLFAPEHVAEQQNILARTLRGEPNQIWKAKLTSKAGTHFEALLTVSPVKIPTGKLIGASVIVREILPPA